MKVMVSALLIGIISEVAKVNTVLGGVINSLPVISLLCFFWLYLETKDTQIIANLSYSTLWFVIPTLPLFLVLPHFLKRGFGFWASISISLGVMVLCYLSLWSVLKRYDI